MTIQLTIIGLGQIGSSAGLALKKFEGDIFRIGHDKSREAVNFAKENDAVDKIALTLSGAVKDADIVLLALPLQEIYPVVEHISQDLKQDALVLDTSPLKVPLLDWMHEMLPPGVNYVGLTPVIKAEYLEEISHGPETAHADLFRGSLMAVVASPAASSKSINMAANFAELLGAAPYFADAAEMDGLMSMTHLMPQLLAAVMLEISHKAPGWREARKFAGKDFSQMTNPFGKDELPGALAAWLDLDQGNTNRLIDDLIRTLVALRDREGASSQEELAESFTRLQQSRDLWLDERDDSPWIDAQKPKLPQREGLFAQMLGFRGPKKGSDDK